MPSPPHAPTVQRETSPIDQIYHVDLVAPLNVPKNIVVGRKILAWARQTLQEVEEHGNPHGTF